MIIGLCGAARSGKDTVADMLTEALDAYTERIQISGPLKTYLRDLFDWTYEHTDGDLKDVPDERYPRIFDRHDWLDDECKRCGAVYEGGTEEDGDPCGIYLTPRHAMQFLGGEFAEATFPAIYAVRAARRAKQATTEENFDLAAITDCRFLRDIQAVKDVGGTIILVRREGDGLTGAAADHPGETARTKPEFLALVDHIIDNDGSLDDLQRKVEAFAWDFKRNPEKSNGEPSP